MLSEDNSLNRFGSLEVMASSWGTAVGDDNNSSASSDSSDAKDALLHLNLTVQKHWGKMCLFVHYVLFFLFLFLLFPALKLLTFAVVSDCKADELPRVCVFRFPPHHWSVMSFPWRNSGRSLCWHRPARADMYRNVLDSSSTTQSLSSLLFFFSHCNLCSSRLHIKGGSSVLIL